MTELSINTKKRAVRLRLELRGEAEPIEVIIKKYHLKRRANRMLLTVEDASASREWITGLLREVMIGRSIAIPEKIGTLLNALT